MIKCVLIPINKYVTSDHIYKKKMYSIFSVLAKRKSLRAKGMFNFKGFLIILQYEFFLLKVFLYILYKPNE
jgi:hypothetical protein